MGSKEFGLEVFKSIHTSITDLNWIIIHPDDTNDPRSAIKEFQVYASNKGIPFNVFNRSTNLLKIVDGINIEIGVICGWYKLLSEEELKLPRFGFWGIHNSLLPLYRGGSPLVWSIIDGGENVGYSVFKIQPEMDSGPIILQEKIDLKINNTISDALNLISQKVTSKIGEKLKQVLGVSENSFEQNEMLATYVNQRRYEDGIVNWQMESIKVHNFIRAQAHPYPGSFSFYKGKRIHFFKSEILSSSTPCHPGEIIEVKNGELIIGCAENSLIKIKDYDFKSFSEPEFFQVGGYFKTN